MNFASKALARAVWNYLFDCQHQFIERRQACPGTLRNIAIKKLKHFQKVIKHRKKDDFCHRFGYNLV